MKTRIAMIALTLLASAGLTAAAAQIYDGLGTIPQQNGQPRNLPADGRSSGYTEPDYSNAVSRYTEPEYSRADSTYSSPLNVGRSDYTVPQSYPHASRGALPQASPNSGSFPGPGIAAFAPQTHNAPTFPNPAGLQNSHFPSFNSVSGAERAREQQAMKHCQEMIGEYRRLMAEREKNPGALIDSQQDNKIDEYRSAIKKTLALRLASDLAQRKKRLEEIERRATQLREQLEKREQNKGQTLDLLMLLVENPSSGLGLPDQWMDMLMQRQESLYGRANYPGVPAISGVSIYPGAPTQMRFPGGLSNSANGNSNTNPNRWWEQRQNSVSNGNLPRSDSRSNNTGSNTQSSAQQRRNANRNTESDDRRNNSERSDAESTKESAVDDPFGGESDLQHPFDVVSSSHDPFDVEPNSQDPFGG